MKQLVTSGVRVFCYLAASERTLDSAIEKIMLSLQTMADEMERVRRGDLAEFRGIAGMARPAGIEPAAPRLGGGCSIR